MELNFFNIKHHVKDGIGWNSQLTKASWWPETADGALTSLI